MLFKSQLAMVRIDYKSELFDKKLMSWGEWQTLKWLAFYKTSEETNSWGVYNNFACLRVSPYAAMSSASARPWSFFLWSCELSRGNNSDATRLLSSCNNKILSFQIRLILNHKTFHNFFKINHLCAVTTSKLKMPLPQGWRNGDNRKAWRNKCSYPKSKSKTSAIPTLRHINHTVMHHQL